MSQVPQLRSNDQAPAVLETSHRGLPARARPSWLARTDEESGRAAARGSIGRGNEDSAGDLEVNATDPVQRAFDALLAKARAEGTRGPTVISVAARASISRSSMYRFHADIVAQIKALSTPKQAAGQDTLRTKLRLLVRQLKSEKDLTKALARACAELAAEKAALAEQLEEEQLRFSLRLEALQKKLRGVKPARLLHPVDGPATS